MPGEPAIVVEHVNHCYGSGALRKQILFDVSTEIRSGEIVILTGPSGSGKTTLLTLIGALRSAQEGSLRVLGQELRGASQRTLQRLRKQIGYIFQAHNLLPALNAKQNVEMSLHHDLSLLDPGDREQAQTQVDEMCRKLLANTVIENYAIELEG